MKKRISLFLIALCLLLTACSKDPGGTVRLPDTFSDHSKDAQNKYIQTTGICFQETDDFFIGNSISGNYFYYYDRQGVLSGLLCADPTCTHDSTYCSAYTCSAASLSYYEGKRYWVSYNFYDDPDNHYLYSSDLPGMNSQKVKKIGLEGIVMYYNPQQYAIHRDYLYAWGVTSLLEQTKVGNRVSLICSPLDSTQEFTVLYKETIPRDATCAMYFLDDDVYFFVHSRAQQEDGFTYSILIKKFNVLNGTEETVYEENDISDLVSNSFWVTESGNIYIGVADALCRIRDGQRETVAKFQSATSAPKLSDGVAASYYLNDGIRCIEVLDFDGTQLYDGPLFPNGLPELDGDPNDILSFGYGLLAGDREKLIINLLSMEVDVNGMAADRGYMYLLDLQNDLAPTLLWHATQ